MILHRRRHCLPPRPSQTVGQFESDERKAVADPTGLRLGAIAPGFTLPDQDGTPRTLEEFRGRPLVLFFYPRADTPICTTEARDFSALIGDFDKSGAAVVGMSADSPRKLARFRDKHDLKVTLLSDEAGDTLRAYGVWGEKTMYGKRFEGIHRTTFLIGRDGRIAQVWKVTRVAGHADAVLNSARKIP